MKINIEDIKFIDCEMFIDNEIDTRYRNLSLLTDEQYGIILEALKNIKYNFFDFDDTVADLIFNFRKSNNLL